MQLTTPKQIRQALTINKEQYDHFIEEGMPYLHIGDKIRFDKTEVIEWFQTYIMRQELLEKAFKDAKGRTIKDYITIGQLKEYLQIKKKEIHKLCEKGMPHQPIGDKLFFQLEEVFMYLRTGKKPYSELTTIIVDGSYHALTKAVCSGMVVQTANGIKGFSKLHEVVIECSLCCEYLALREALRYVKEQQFTNVVIGTDQKDFVSILKKGEQKYFTWMKKEPHQAIIDEVYTLIDELKESIRIVYANVPDYEFLYKNAHALSRNYETITVDEILLGEPLETKKKIDYTFHALNLVTLSEVDDDPKQTLQMKFDCVQGDYAYFYVTIGDETKRTKMQMKNSTPSRAAILLAYSYLQTAKAKMNIYIDSIATFEEDMKAISLSSVPKKTFDIIEKLYESANFNPKDDFAAYLDNEKGKLNIA